MNYKWNVSKHEGQAAIGYVFSCETIAENIPVMAMINCFPKVNQFGNNKIASIVIFWECNKDKVTDGLFHWVMDDVGEIIKNNECCLFDNSLQKFDSMMSQHYFVEKLPKLTYFTHGDYAVC